MALWAETIRRPIDLLFIDGCHALQHVFEDFTSWVPFLNPGGEVIFHDYDSIERGGLVHLGATVFLKTILRLEFLKDPVHCDRLLYGTLCDPIKAKLSAEDCKATLIDLGNGIVHMRNEDYSGWIIVGEERFAKMLRGCLKMGNAEFPPLMVSPSEGNYLVFERPLAPALDALREKGIKDDRITAIDSLHACYLIAHGLEKNRNYLLSLTSSRKELFRWEEQVFMLEHAMNGSCFPERVGDCSGLSDIVSLSRLVATEQLRLTFLARMMETFVDWKA